MNSCFLTSNAAYFLVLRCPFQMDIAAFSTSCDALSKTRYKLEATNNEIPQYGNCVTSVRYLIQKSSHAFLPRVWIGDLPRALISHGWKLILINSAEMLRGDLLFLRDEDHPYRISHLMIAIKANIVFHCSYNLTKPIDSYGNSLMERIVNEARIMLCYIDVRNFKLRPLPIPRNPNINQSTHSPDYCADFFP